MGVLEAVLIGGLLFIVPVSVVLMVMGLISHGCLAGVIIGMSVGMGVANISMLGVLVGWAIVIYSFYDCIGPAFGSDVDVADQD